MTTSHDADRDRAKLVRNRVMVHMAMAGETNAPGWEAEAAIRAMLAFADEATRPPAQAGAASVECGAKPDHADIMETIQNASDTWQKDGYTSALAEVRDMANVGRALMEALPKGYCYMECPSEIVSDLQNELDEARATPAASGEIPGGMKPWPGGPCAPTDASDPVVIMTRGGSFTRMAKRAVHWQYGTYIHEIGEPMPPDCDVIAYTPITTPKASAETSERADDEWNAKGVGQDELVAGFKRALQDPDGDHDGWTDAGMENAFFRWPFIVRALNEARAALSAAPSAPATEAGEEGTGLGEVLCHCSEDDGVPDVGVSVGLGNGRMLWLGELLTRDGGDIGLVFHGPDGLRIAAPLWPNCEWQEAADLLRHHVGPALATPTDQVKDKMTDLTGFDRESGQNGKGGGA